MKAKRTRFYCVLKAESGDSQLSSSIQVIVPTGLTLTEAVTYITNRISEEVSRYAAYEALGISYVSPDDDLNEIVT
jgi:hypothetical protein